MGSGVIMTLGQAMDRLRDEPGWFLGVRNDDEILEWHYIGTDYGKCLREGRMKFEGAAFDIVGRGEIPEVEGMNGEPTAQDVLRNVRLERERSMAAGEIAPDEDFLMKKTGEKEVGRQGPLGG